MRAGEEECQTALLLGGVAPNNEFQNPFTFICTFAKLRKAAISFVTSVCLSVCPHGTTRFPLRCVIPVVCWKTNNCMLDDAILRAIKSRRM